MKVAPLESQASALRTVAFHGVNQQHKRGLHVACGEAGFKSFLAKCCEEPGTGNVCYSLCSANIQLSEDKAMSFSNVFSAFVSNTAVSFAR